MTASRKDYVAIAHELRQARPAPDEWQARNQWDDDVLAVAKALGNTSGYTGNGNRSFNTDTFLAACGYNDPEEES